MRSCGSTLTASTYTHSAQSTCASGPQLPLARPMGVQLAHEVLLSLEALTPACAPRGRSAGKPAETLAHHLHVTQPGMCMLTCRSTSVGAPGSAGAHPERKGVARARVRYKGRQ